MRTLCLGLFLLLAACDRGPQAPTAAQNDQMNEAGAVLDDMTANENAGD